MVGLYESLEERETLLHIESAFVSRCKSACYLYLVSRFDLVHQISSQNDLLAPWNTSWSHVRGRFLHSNTSKISIDSPVVGHPIGPRVLTGIADIQLDLGVIGGVERSLDISTPQTFIVNLSKLTISSSQMRDNSPGCIKRWILLII